MTKSIYLLLFLCSNIFLFSQDTLYNIDRIFTEAELTSDFNTLCSAIEEIHPSLYRFTTPEKLEEKKKTIVPSFSSGMTELEFQLKVREYIIEIGCGHSVSFPSKNWFKQINKDKFYVPFIPFIIEDEIFIKRNYSDSEKLSPGTKVLKINEIPSAEILQKMRAIQQVDGYGTTFKENNIRSKFILMHLMLYGPIKDYTIEIENKKGEIEKIPCTYIVQEKINSENTVNDKSLLSMSDGLFYIHKNQPNLAVMDIDAFNRKGFKKFYKKAFKEMEEKGITHLVLDLRNNGGGYFPNGNNLLQYVLPEKFTMDFSRRKNKVKSTKLKRMNPLSKVTKVLFGIIPDKNKNDPMRNYAIPYKVKKRNHFNGQIYVLTNGGSFSLSGMVSAKLNHHTNAIFIGEETGGGEVGSHAILSYSLYLDHTNIQVVLPHYFLDHDVEPNQKGRGVLPNYPISYSIENRLDNDDLEMMKVLELIQKE